MIEPRDQDDNLRSYPFLHVCDYCVFCVDELEFILLRKTAKDTLPSR